MKDSNIMQASPAATGEMFRLGWLSARPALVDGAIIALTVVFGLQTIRVLLPSLIWVAGNSMHLNSIELGLIGLATFLVSFTAGPLLRSRNVSSAMLVAAGGVGLLRLVLQILDDPLINLILAIAGTALFIVFIPLSFEIIRHRTGQAGFFIFGFLAGFLFDTVINGTFGTYDLAWQIGLVPILVSSVLVAALGLALFAGRRPGNAEPSQATPPAGAPRLRALAWAAIGPFMFLQMELFQSIPRIATLTGWALPSAFLWTIASQVAGFGAASLLLSRPGGRIWSWALISGPALFVLLVLPGYQTSSLASTTFAAVIFVGQIALVTLLTIIVIGIMEGTGQSTGSSVVAANGTGMVVFVALVFGYYAAYDMSLPYANTLLEPIAVLMVALAAIGVSFARRSERTSYHPVWAVPAVSLLFLIVPLTPAAIWNTPEPVVGDGFPVRIMSYNLASGFSRGGDLNMENIARVVEDGRADIVALQEVSRGWLISGRMDMLTWLSQRLDMPYVSGPTETLWGNAILSRYPIIEYANYELQPQTLNLLRGFTRAVIDVGGGNRLNVITTHLHQINADVEIRQLQVDSILEVWNKAGQTVILGDLNADPESQEMEMLRQAGFIDCAAFLSPSPATTTVDNRRLDYIWITPDLEVTEFTVPKTDASDHLPIIALIGG